MLEDFVRDVESRQPAESRRTPGHAWQSGCLFNIMASLLNLFLE